MIHPRFQFNTEVIMKKIFIILIVMAIAGCAGNFAKQRKISGPTCEIAMEKLGSNDMQGALVELKRAQKANPVDPEVYFGFAMTYSQWNKPAEALPYVDKAIEYSGRLELDHPGMKSESYNLKGSILAMLKKNDEALKYFKKALEDDVYKTPEYTLYNMALVYITMGNLPEAKNSLSKAVDIKPDYAPAWDALGVIYSKTGDNAAAIEALKKALAAYPDYIEAHWDIAQVYAETGNTEDAKQHLIEVIRLDKTGGFSIRAKEKLAEIGAME
jgi:type IV pilus assembly protein PilF